MKKDRVFMALLALALVSTVIGFFNSFGETNQSPLTNLFLRFANVFAFMAILWYAGVKKMLAGLGTRRASIEKELNDLELRRVEAEKSLANVERSIANISSEREAIFAEYHVQGEAIKATIIAKAEASAIQMAEQAKRAAENEVTHAIDMMRAEMADLIVQNTEVMLKKKLNADSHEKLIDNYITKVVLN